MAKWKCFQGPPRTTQIRNEPVCIVEVSDAFSTVDADFFKSLFQLLRVQMVVVVPSEEERNEAFLQFLVLSL